MINHYPLHVVSFTSDLLSLAEKFDSGHTPINQFLQDGDQSLNTNIGKTYVLLSQDDRYIIGYYNLGVGSVNYINGTINMRMGGAITVNYFALDINYQKQAMLKYNNTTIYLSDLFFNDCIKRIKYIVLHYVGATFITLNSNKEGYNLYTRNGFMKLEDDMYITKKENDYKCISLYRCIEDDI